MILEVVLSELKNNSIDIVVTNIQKRWAAGVPENDMKYSRVQVDGCVMLLSCCASVHGTVHGSVTTEHQPARETQPETELL